MFLILNHTAPYFQNTFSQGHLWRAASGGCITTIPLSKAAFAKLFACISNAFFKENVPHMKKYFVADVVNRTKIFHAILFCYFPFILYYISIKVQNSDDCLCQQTLFLSRV